MMHLFSLSLTLFAIAGIATAQPTGTIAGRVLNSAGKPVMSAAIKLPGTTRGVLSKRDGSYRIAGIPPGMYATTVEAAGYRTGRQDSIRVYTDLETLIDYTLVPVAADTMGVVFPNRGMTWRRDSNATPSVGTPRSSRPVVIGVPGKRGGVTSPKFDGSTFENLRRAIARSGGVSAGGRNCILIRSYHAIEIRIDNEIYPPLPRIPQVSYARYYRDRGTGVTSVTSIINRIPSGYGRMIGIRDDGVMLGDPFSGTWGESFSGYYPMTSTLISTETLGVGGFEPEYGDVVNLRPEEIGTDAITPQEYCRITGSNPYNTADARFTSFLGSLGDPFSTRQPIHRAGSFPRRTPATDTRRLPPDNPPPDPSFYYMGF